MAQYQVKTVSPRESGPQHIVPITVDLLNRCLDRVALAIERAGNRGAVYLPIYERLESEIETLKANQGRMDRVKQRIRR